MPNPYHLTAADVASLPATLNVHSVNPDARRTISSPCDATGPTTLGVNIFVVAPGDESTEYHVHACEDEAVYVLSGTGTALTDAYTDDVGPGISSATPREVLPMKSAIPVKALCNCWS